MTENDYDPWGTTALLDAIGGAIRHVSNIHKYARPEDVPSSTVFVITTDGMENSSKEYSRHEVKRMIEEKTESHGWEFIFVAANIDTVETARSFGIRKERAAKYSHDGDGVLAVVLYPGADGCREVAGGGAGGESPPFALAVRAESSWQYDGPRRFGV